MVGVPEITPFEKDRPAARIGLISQVVGVPPVTDGVKTFILLFRVSVKWYSE